MTSTVIAHCITCGALRGIWALAVVAYWVFAGSCPNFLDLPKGQYA